MAWPNLERDAAAARLQRRDLDVRGEAAAVTQARVPATFESLNTWYYADAPKTVRPQLERR